MIWGVLAVNGKDLRHGAAIDLTAGRACEPTNL